MLIQTRTPRGACAVIVVTKASCGVSRPLTEDWVTDLHAASDSVGAAPLLHWYVASDDNADEAHVSQYWQAVPLTFVRTQHQELLELVGGVTPQTFLVRESGEIVGIVQGNVIPSASAIQYACGL